MTGNVFAAILTRLGALDVNMRDFLATGLIKIPRDLDVVVVETVVARIENELQSGTTDCLPQSQLTLRRSSVTAAVLVGQDDALPYRNGG